MSPAASALSKSLARLTRSAKSTRRAAPTPASSGLGARKSFLSVLHTLAGASSPAAGAAAATKSRTVTEKPDTKQGSADSGVRSKKARAAEARAAADVAGEAQELLVAAALQGTPTAATRALARAKAAPQKSSGEPRAPAAAAGTSRAQPKVALIDLRAPEAEPAKAQKGETPRKASGTGASGLEAQPKRQAAAGGFAEIVALKESADKSAAEAQAPLHKDTAELQIRPAASRAVDAPVAGTRFSEALRDEVVRQATVVVRDGGQGEIRLLLKPESLGEVRIRMKVVDDSIEGRIMVRSAEAREIFRENLPSLESALRDQGFLNARLDVSVSDGGRERQEAETPAPTVSRIEALGELDRSAKVVLSVDAGTHTVDLVA